MFPVQSRAPRHCVRQAELLVIPHSIFHQSQSLNPTFQTMKTPTQYNPLPHLCLFVCFLLPLCGPLYQDKLKLSPDLQRAKISNTEHFLLLLWNLRYTSKLSKDLCPCGIYIPMRESTINKSRINKKIV